jgi:tetratricopeptide (TPR) repeat protein
MYPSNTQLENETINTFLDANRSDDAISLLNKRVLKNPNAEDYSMIGILFDNKGNKTEASKNYEKAISINPNHYDALYNLGVFYFNEAANQKSAGATGTSQRRNFEQAASYFERAYKIRTYECKLTENLNKTYELLDSSRRVECYGSPPDLKKK